MKKSGKYHGRTSYTLLYGFCVLFLVALFLVDLMIGSTTLSVSDIVEALTGGSDKITRSIVVDIRLVKAVVAVLAGAALSVSGLMMQTLFANPLAGPYVLGISSGAGLGVALFIMGAPLLAVSVSSVGIVGAAWIGAAAVFVILALLARRIKDIMVILILGMMLSSGISAIVQVLQYMSHESALKSYIIWTMGSLGEVSAGQLEVFIPAIAVGIIISTASVKQLNMLLMGEEYALTMGLNINRTRGFIFVATTLLAGTVTAYCGPIGFIGLVMPHVTRFMYKTSDHRVLMPATMLTGAAVMILCDIVSKYFLLPVNAVTSLLGVPVVVWIVLSNARVIKNR